MPFSSVSQNPLIVQSAEKFHTESYGKITWGKREGMVFFTKMREETVKGEILKRHGCPLRQNKLETS